MSLIIGISGGTGSGKTTVANRILETVKASEVVFIQQDSYYRNLKDLPLDYRQLANFDHPDALDNDLLVNHIRRLKAGEPVELPIYDFRTHSRLPATTRVEPKPALNTARTSSSVAGCSGVCICGNFAALISLSM